MNITPDRQTLIVDALDAGSSLEEAADLAGVSRKVLHDALVDGIRAGESGMETPEAAFAFAARAASARWRVSLRSRAAESAGANHRVAAEWLRLLDEAKSRAEPDPETDVRAHLVPIHDPGVRAANRALLRELERARVEKAGV